MTQSSYSYFFSSDPANGAILLDNTGSRFMVQLNQPITFPRCKNIDMILNSASIWYTQPNISATLYDNATFSFTISSQTINVTLPAGLYSLTDVYSQIALLADLQLSGYSFEKLFSFNSIFSTQKVAIEFLQNNLRINWASSTVRKLLGFDIDQDSYPNQSSGGNINDIVNKSLVANNVGNFSALTSFYIHSNLVNNGISINGQYNNILGEIPITASPGELINYKSLAPAISFNANELVNTSWSSLQFWISSQNEGVLSMNGEAYSFSITVICTF